MDAKQLEALKIEHPDLADKLDELAAQHRRIDVASTTMGPAILRGATGIEWKRFQDACLDDKRKAGAVPNLVRTCVVYPSREVFDGWLDEQPGITSACAPVAVKLSGGELVDREKK